MTLLYIPTKWRRTNQHNRYGGTNDIAAAYTPCIQAVFVSQFFHWQLILIVIIIVLFMPLLSLFIIHLFIVDVCILSDGLKARLFVFWYSDVTGVRQTWRPVDIRSRLTTRWRRQCRWGRTRRVSRNDRRWSGTRCMNEWNGDVENGMMRSPRLFMLLVYVKPLAGVG